MAPYLYAFFGAMLVAILILLVVDFLYRDKVDWLKCRLCKWWNNEAKD